jgi:two-component system nitrate/nitrite response regulator NarL
MQIKLFIVGDVRLHRDGLAYQLADVEGLEVVGAGSLSEAVQTLRSKPADVALLDSCQQEIPAMVESLRQTPAALRIVALGVREVESEVLACAAAGADGYVRREAAIGDVAAVIESVMRDELVCSPKVAATLYHSIASASVEGGARLTSRELQVVELVNQGLSNKEISRHLSIEASTAKNHIQNIMQKLGVHRRGQAVAKLRSIIGRQFG